MKGINSLIVRCREKHVNWKEAQVIEITKACTVAFMKAKNSLVVRCREKHVNCKKTQNIVKIYFLKR